MCLYSCINAPVYSLSIPQDKETAGSQVYRAAIRPNLEGLLPFQFRQFYMISTNRHRPRPHPYLDARAVQSIVVCYACFSTAHTDYWRAVASHSTEERVMYQLALDHTDDIHIRAEKQLLMTLRYTLFPNVKTLIHFFVGLTRVLRSCTARWGCAMLGVDASASPALGVSAPTVPVSPPVAIIILHRTHTTCRRLR